MINEICLHAYDDTVLNTLLSETWSCAVLDCGATTTVCGSKWFDDFSNSLSTEQREKIQFAESAKPFRFGDGVVMNSKKRATFPAFIGSQSIWITTEIVDANIPLLLSIKAMKKANLNLDFCEVFQTGGGMKNRVTLSMDRLDEVIRKLHSFQP